MHRGMFEDQVLDLVDVNFLAAAIDEVPLAALRLDMAATLGDDVAHSIEAVRRKGAGVDIGRIVVAANGIRAAG